MPGGNRRGPSGLGPMTGRGMGFCSGYDRPGFAGNYPQRGSGRRGFAGGGYGGGGRGFRNRFFQTHAYGIRDYAGAYELTPEKEIEMLKNEAKSIELEMDSIQSRIAELEAISRENSND